MPDPDPFAEAQHQQAHGGLQSSWGGSFLQWGGKFLQSIPPSFKPRRIPVDAGGTLLGKGLEHVGKRVQHGLPQDRSLYDILHHDMGHSHLDTLEMIRNRK